MSVAVLQEPDADASTSVWLSVVRSAEQECALADPAASAAERRSAGADPRCASSAGSGQMVWLDPRPSSTVVDDGTVVRALDVPGSQVAADALRQGRVVVSDAYDVRPDGTTRLEIARTTATDPEQEVLATLDAPATAVDLGNDVQFSVILPPTVADQLGARTRSRDWFATTTRLPTQAEQDATDAELLLAAPVASLTIERGYRGGQPMTVWILVGAALLVGLGATGISVALAAVESRPDLATLAAVGAAPRLRRKIAAAQAGVLSGVGVLLGVATGLLLGRVLVLSERFRWEVVDPDWVTVVPWPAVAAIAFGVPVAAMVGAFALTRSRLPMIRRLAQ